MVGTIVADETWIGGKESNKHASKRRPIRIVPGQKDTYPGKTAVMSIINADTGEVRSQVITDTSSGTLGKVLSSNVNMSESVLWTDAGRGYIPLSSQFLDHQSVNHTAGEYVRYMTTGAVGTNKAENFFSQLKRSIDGTHHQVTSGHLPRYLGEFGFRYNTRKLADSDRFDVVGTRLEKRLSYRELLASAR